MGAVGATELERFKEELAEVLTGRFEGRTDWTARIWANYSTPWPVILSALPSWLWPCGKSIG